MHVLPWCHPAPTRIDLPMTLSASKLWTGDSMVQRTVCNLQISRPRKGTRSVGGLSNVSFPRKAPPMASTDTSISFYYPLNTVRDFGRYILDYTGLLRVFCIHVTEVGAWRVSYSARLWYRQHNSWWKEFAGRHSIQGRDCCRTVRLLKACFNFHLFVSCYFLDIILEAFFGVCPTLEALKQTVAFWHFRLIFLHYAIVVAKDFNYSTTSFRLPAYYTT